MRAGEAAVGFVEGPVDDPALDVVPIAQDQLLIVVAPEHPWAEAAPGPDELTASAWVMREAGSGTRAEFEAALGRMGILAETLQIAMELPGNEAVRAAAEAGAGAAALSASVVAGSLEAGLLHHVPISLPARSFRLVRHRERYRSKAADALTALVGVPAPLSPGRAASPPGAVSALKVG